jgi:hypothetical protein
MYILPYQSNDELKCSTRTEVEAAECSLAGSPEEELEESKIEWDH